MSRIAAFLLLAALPACSAPALATWTSNAAMESHSTSEGASSSTDGSTSRPGVMTSADSASGGEDTTGGDDTETSSTGSSSTTTTDADSSTTANTTTSTSTTTTGAPECGNGVVEGDEECDDRYFYDLDRCANNCTINRRIFASAASDHSGDLNGLDGADSLCRQYALQSGKFDDTWKTFIAWLSDADHDVRDRLAKGRGRFLRTDDVVVADNVEQLLSGTLSAPIDHDEHGKLAPGGALTGTRPDGTAAPGTHCQNWTSGSGLEFSAYVGNTEAVDENWTLYSDPQVNPTSCIGNMRLYCVEGG